MVVLFALLKWVVILKATNFVFVWSVGGKCQRCFARVVPCGRLDGAGGGGGWGVGVGLGPGNDNMPATERKKNKNRHRTVSHGLCGIFARLCGARALAAKCETVGTLESGSAATFG